MRLVLISDTHTCFGISVPEGDVLVHAGDSTSQGTLAQVIRFLEWFSAQPHPHKIFIAGNHDWFFAREPDQAARLLAEWPDLVYLEDAGIEIDGVKFWGSPWQPAFCDLAFNLPRKGYRLREVWNRIPLGTDVLITHGPPYGALDQVGGGEHLGCEKLKLRCALVKPRFHVFGHIHDSYGVAYAGTRVLVNASICNEAYRPVHRPIVADIWPGRVEVQGTELWPQRERLMALKAVLDAAEHSRGEIREVQFQGLLNGMAEYLGKAPDELNQDYLERGLRSDLVRFFRSEGRPGRRPLPVKDLEDYEDA